MNKFKEPHTSGSFSKIMCYAQPPTNQTRFVDKFTKNANNIGIPSAVIEIESNNVAKMKVNRILPNLIGWSALAFSVGSCA